MSGNTRSYARGMLRYDPVQRRLWIREQRLHHGLTGLMLAAAGLVLMAHDWHDRSAWFKSGPQEQ